MESCSQSSDYFKSEGSEFREALLNAKLPGDIRCSVSQRSLSKASTPYKHPARLSQRSNESSNKDPSPLNPNHSEQKLGKRKLEAEAESHVFAQLNFDGNPLSRKRLKKEIALNEPPGIGLEGRKILSGLIIHLNGSSPHLQKLIRAHGGSIYRPYLDQKSRITHIVVDSEPSSSQIREFEGMKVVKPEWLTESIRACALLPWEDFSTFLLALNKESSRKTTPQKKSNTRSSLEVNPSIPRGRSSTPRNSSPNELKSDGRAPRRKSPSYATHKSNLIAQRAMASSEWRSAHTSAAPGFVEGFYKNSRLHYLSIWKAELKELVAKAREWAGNRVADNASLESLSRLKDNDPPLIDLSNPYTKGKGKAKANGESDRTIMHCDFDCFFVSAGLITRPHLRGKPAVVCHSQGSQGGESSTSEIASASYEARELGIKNGMSLHQARSICPDILTIPYEFESYKQISIQMYSILMGFADDVQAVSVDEALIDVSSHVKRARAEAKRLGKAPGSAAKDLAEKIRAQVKEATECELSIGIAHNILLARLATRRAKPGGSYHLRDKFEEFLAPLDICDLHGFGPSARQKALEKLGVTRVCDLLKKSKGVLCDALGKVTGETLYNAIRGIDDKKLESDQPRKSVSCEISYGIRFDNEEQVERFINQMAEELSQRLCSVNLKGRLLTLKIMKRAASAPAEPAKFLGHGKCDSMSKQAAIGESGGRATNNARLMSAHVMRLLNSLKIEPSQLCGIGIQMQNLESSSETFTVDPRQPKLTFKTIKPPEAPKQVTNPEPKAFEKYLETTLPEVAVQDTSPPPAAIELASATVLEAQLPDPKPVVLESVPLGKHLPSDANPPFDLHLKSNVGPPDAESGVIVPAKFANAEPSESNNYHALPSFSQVDQEVFGALPDDVRRELESEYSRRSVPPQPPFRSSTRERASEPPQQKSGYNGRGHYIPKNPTNYKRIAQALRPQQSGSSISPVKSLLFAPRGEALVQISEAELKKLDIDPQVFLILPVELQREQLALARQSRQSKTFPKKATKS